MKNFFNHFVFNQAAWINRFKHISFWGSLAKASLAGVHFAIKMMPYFFHFVALTSTIPLLGQFLLGMPFIYSSPFQLCLIAGLSVGIIIYQYYDMKKRIKLDEQIEKNKKTISKLKKTLKKLKCPQNPTPVLSSYTSNKKRKDPLPTSSQVKLTPSYKKHSRN